MTVEENIRTRRCSTYYIGYVSCVNWFWNAEINFKDFL